MSERTARRLSVSLGVATLLVAAGALVLTAGSVVTTNGDLPFIISVTIGVAGFAIVGAILTSRTPTNPIGWLFQGTGICTALAILTEEYALRGSTDLAGLPGVPVAAVLNQALFPPALAGILTVFLIFPDGHVLSRRWRPVLWVLWGGAAIASASTILAAQVFEIEGDVAIVNPFAVAPQTVADLAGSIAILGLLVAGISALISMLIRFRSSSGETRQQVRWLAWAASLILLSAIAVIVTGTLAGPDGSSAVNDIAFYLMVASFFLGLPIATAVAILRYRLYDLDLVIKKTVVFAICVVLVMAVSLVVVVVVVIPISWLTGSAGRTNALFFFLIGLLLWPLWRLSRRIADRIVFGGRASPYEVLAEFSERMSESYATDDVLPRMARVVREATAASSATVWLRVGSEIRPAATSGDRGPEDAVPLDGDGLPELTLDLAVEVRHQGSLLGALSVTMHANDPMNTAKERLVTDLAAQAGLVLRNVRLIEELRGSRRRLVAAQDQERRRLERNIHDGAQQQLVALQVKQRLAEQLLDRDPAKTRDLLGQLQIETAAALDELRDLARGIYPPLLADRGLAAALEGQARKSTPPATVAADGIDRYPQEVEAAVYFSCLEALQNVGKYAGASHTSVSLSQTNGELRFSVVDDGRGFDPAEVQGGTGLQGMADRLDAIGGTLAIESRAGSGTSISGSVPLGAAGEARR